MVPSAHGTKPPWLWLVQIDLYLWNLYHMISIIQVLGCDVKAHLSKDAHAFVQLIALFDREIFFKKIV